MDDEDDFRFSVVDVYDIAADIGKEFEKIIEQYGSEALTSLMPRVITALEQLERLAERQETSGGTIDELRTTIATLEHQKLGLAEHRQRYARDLEDIERDMREERQELSAKVSQLLDENRKLSTSLARSADNTPCITDDESSLEPDVNRGVVTRLQDALESQRDQLHRLQQQHQLQQAENDQLGGQVERLTQSNKDLRRRARQSTQQIRQLVEERAELHVTLQEQQRSLDQLQQRLGVAAKENYDLATAAATSDPLDAANKLVYDRNDPNRPRFTLTELKDILYQRNELKARLSDLEDELSIYRPSNTSASKQQGGSHIICPPDEAQGPPLVDLDELLEETEGRSASAALDDPPPPADDSDDPPVQGPMPYEPDDAPWKRRTRESGIRKFFARVKKLSDALLPSEDVVMGTPSSTTLFQTTPPLQRAPYQYHSTPASTLSTPLNSMNVSSPPSLHSLPSQLNSKGPTISLGRKYADTSISPRDDSGYGSSIGLPFKNPSKTSVKSTSVSSSFTFEKFRMRFGLPPAGELIFKNSRSEKSAARAPASNAAALLGDKSASGASNFGILAFEEYAPENSGASANSASDPMTTRDRTVAYGTGARNKLPAGSSHQTFSGGNGPSGEPAAGNVSGALAAGNVSGAPAAGNVSGTPADGNVSGAPADENFVSSASGNGSNYSEGDHNVSLVSKELMTSKSAVPKTPNSPNKESTTIRNLVSGVKMTMELSSQSSDE